jgi:hypothetical protein
MSKRPNPKPRVALPNDMCKYKPEKPRQPFYFLAIIVCGYICLAASWASKNLYSEPFAERAKDLQERINEFQSLANQARDAQTMEEQASWHKDSSNAVVKNFNLKLYIFSIKGVNYMLKTFETEGYDLFPFPSFEDSLKSEQLILNNQKMEIESLFNSKQYGQLQTIKEKSDIEYNYLSKVNTYPARTAWGFMNEYKAISQRFNTTSIVTLILGTLMITFTKILSWRWGNKV